MTQYSRCYQLKDRAKDALRGKYRPAMYLCVLSALISMSASLFVDDCMQSLLPAVPGLSDGFTPWKLLPSFLLSSAASFLLNTLLGIFQLGVALFFLNAACGQPGSLWDLFYGFRQDNAAKAATISAVRTLVELAGFLAFRFFLNCYLMTGSPDWLFASAVALAAGACIAIPISLSLELSFYLMLDFPDKSARELMGSSIRIMYGHKKRFFFIKLSFLPLTLLGVCSFYIGFLWIMPYVQMTYVHFFLDTMNPQKSTASPQIGGT